MNEKKRKENCWIFFEEIMEGQKTCLHGIWPPIIPSSLFDQLLKFPLHLALILGDLILLICLY